MSEPASATMAADGAPRMRNPSLLAWTVTGIVVLASGFVEIAAILDSPRPIDLLWPVLPPLYAILGSIIVSRSQANRIGWLLIAIGAAMAFQTELIIDLAVLEGHPTRMTPGWLFILLADQVAWMLWLFPLFLMLCVFPSGRLLSPRWRWVPILQVLMFTTLSTLLVFGKEIGPFSDAWSLQNPIGFIDGWLFESSILFIPWGLGLAALVLGSVTSIAMRYRRSDDVERAQLRWMLYAVFVFGLAYAVLLVTSDWGGDHLMPALALVAGVAGIAVAIIVAVLKFHLYDIDVIISRSITFGVLAVFIASVYVAIIVVIGRLFDQADGAGVGLSIAATAVVALAFQPVRARVERWANRLVYGKRATPYEVLSGFSHRTVEESDEDLVARVPRLIVDGTGASSATVWVRSRDDFRSLSLWPEWGGARVLESDTVFVDPDADMSLPVFHDGELLGGISLVAARGGTITPPEEELVARLAEGLGLTLRNSRLTEALRRQVKDLQRSRDRVASAADEARRSLEHDLDSGPQQQLVAVKVKLGPLRKLAEQAGAVRAAEVLADVEVQTGEAIRTVRDFATGIYPPLLGADGLAVALAHETRKAALPVEVDAADVRRYPRDVEAAVYFSVLEALQNTAKYANASRAVVRLTGSTGGLRFEVIDDGNGFDSSAVRRGAGLNGIADRIDSVGGSCTIISTPGQGATVTGIVPVRERIVV